MLRSLSLGLIGQCNASPFNPPDTLGGKHCYYPCLWSRKLKLRSLLRSHILQAARPGMGHRQAGAGPRARQAIPFCLLSSMVPGHPQVPVFPTQDRCPPLSLLQAATSSNVSYGWAWRTCAPTLWVPVVWGTDTPLFHGVPLSSHLPKDDLLPWCLLAHRLRGWTMMTVLSWYVTPISHLLPTHCSSSPSHLTDALKTPGISRCQQVIQACNLPTEGNSVG